MAFVAVRQGFFPRASAELAGSFLPSRGDILMSATITVEFSPTEWINVTDSGANVRGGKSEPPALLLTLSPLHRIREVRVWLEKEEWPTGDSVGEWRLLDLNGSTLFETKRRVVRPDDGAVQSSAPAAPLDEDCISFFASQEKVIERDKEEDRKDEDEGDGDDGDGDNEVLELVLASTDDDEETVAGEGIFHSVTLENEDNDNTGVQFMIRMCSCATDGKGMAGDGKWFMTRCCIDVGLIPQVQLASISYPRVSIASSMGPMQPPQRLSDSDDEGYVLLTGQRFYDYFICPRVAYAEEGADAASFTNVDVYVTEVCPISGDMAIQWEVLTINALPVLPEDLVCAFVRPSKRHMWPPGEEIHAEVRWRVQHHPAYTLLSIDSDSCGGGEKQLYFFHCDHFLCGYLLSSARVAYTAWEAVGALTGLRTAACVDPEHRRKEITWVITDSSSALLSLRRGALCTRGAVVLVADLLRTMRTLATTTSVSAVFCADALRAKATVLSAALECKWRISVGNGVVPKFDGVPLNASLVRAWALCLLCGEPGWTELINQERNIALSWIFITNGEDPWWLAQRYVQEVCNSLVFLSSAFAVASVCSCCCYPWQLLEGGGYKLPLALICESNVSISSGMHLRLMQMLLQGQRHWRRQHQDGDVFLPSAAFVGLLYYEESHSHAAYSKIALRLKPAKAYAFCRLLNGDMQAADTIWSIDVPFTVVYFTIEELKVLSTLAVAERKEKELHCRATNILSCHWRVSGLTWARGLDQYTSFFIMKSTQEDDLSDNERSANMDEEEGSEKSFSLHIPLLVLNPKLVPPALSLRVQHSQVWLGVSSSLGKLARQIMLQYVMEQAAQEGENVVEEADLVFTPLMNQLLEGVIEGYSCSSSVSAESFSLLLFLEALQGVKCGPSAVRCRIHPSIYTRFMRLVFKHNGSPLAALGLTVKRQRDEDIDRYVQGDVFELATRVLDYIRCLEAYDATLPRMKPRPQRELRQQPPRLVLSLRKRLVIRHVQEEEKKTLNRNGANSLPTPVDLAAMISRVITASAGVSETGSIFSARLAAFSLTLPIWLLLHEQCGLSGGQRAALVEEAQRIYASLRGNITAIDSDAVFLKAYECFGKKAEGEQTIDSYNT